MQYAIPEHQTNSKHKRDMTCSQGARATHYGIASPTSALTGSQTPFITVENIKEANLTFFKSRENSAHREGRQVNIRKHSRVCSSFVCVRAWLSLLRQTSFGYQSFEEYVTLVTRHQYWKRWVATYHINPRWHRLLEPTKFFVAEHTKTIWLYVSKTGSGCFSPPVTSHGNMVTCTVALSWERKVKSLSFYPLFN